MATTDDKLRLIIETQDKFSKDLKKYDSQVNKIAKNSATATAKTSKLGGGMALLGKALPVLALGLVAKRMFSYIKSTNEAIDETLNLNAVTGVAVSNLSALNHVFEENKAKASDVAGTFRYITKTLGALETATPSTINKFAELGVATKTVDGELRGLEDIFYDSIDVLNEESNATTRSAKATQLFGKSAGNLASVIKLGSKGIKEQVGHAKNLGMTYDRDGAIKAQEFNDSLLILTDSLKGVGYELTASLSPALTSTAKLLTANLQVWRSWSSQIYDSIASMQSLTIGDIEVSTDEKPLLVYTKAMALQEIEVRKNQVALQSLKKGTDEYYETLTNIDDAQEKQISILKKAGDATDIGIVRIKEIASAQYKAMIATEKLTKARKKQSEIAPVAKTKALTKAVTEKAGKEVDLGERRATQEEIVRAQMQETADIERELMKEAELYRLTGSDRELKRLEQEFASKRDLYIDYNGDIIALNEEFERQKTEITESEAEKQRAITEANFAKESQVFDMKLSQAEAYTKGLASLASLAVDGDKDAANKKKRIATGEAIIYGGLTQAKVWSEWGWPAGLPWSIAALGTTAANIATIQSANFTNGGLIAGTSQYGDKTNINVNADERVLTRSDQSYLTDVLKSRSANGNGNNQTVINISGNYGVNENALARMVVNGTNQADKTNQPNRILV